MESVAITSVQAWYTAARTRSRRAAARPQRGHPLPWRYYSLLRRSSWSLKGFDPAWPFLTACPGRGLLHALADISCPRAVRGNNLSIRSRVASVSRGMGRQMAHMSAPAEGLTTQCASTFGQGSCGRCSAPQSARVVANASTLSGDGIGTSRSRRARRAGWRWSVTPPTA